MDTLFVAWWSFTILAQNDAVERGHPLHRGCSARKTILVAVGSKFAELGFCNFLDVVKLMNQLGIPMLNSKYPENFLDRYKGLYCEIALRLYTLRVRQ
ncbi:hypothetical protein [Ruegeria hyattellae]|uniref:hypothetical protein n=1 Tax=Ruegeria hyattellae TaxID=3233337 RepID=UPI00355C28EF